jgi:hypothetical protein
MVDLTPQIANFYIRQAQSQASANDYSRLAAGSYYPVGSGYNGYTYDPSRPVPPLQTYALPQAYPSLPGVIAGNPITSGQSFTQTLRDSAITGAIAGAITGITGSPPISSTLGLAGFSSPRSTRLFNNGLPNGATYVSPNSSSPQFYSASQPNENRVMIVDQSGYIVGGGGITDPLTQFSGVLFPLTPTVSVTHTANYENQNLVHTNYTMPMYTHSAVDNISIEGVFIANDPTDAKYTRAAIHFFRSATKMFYGQDSLAGTPPPVLYLDGYGKFMFDHIPVVVKSFDYSLPNDVDYIDTDPGNSNSDESTMIPTQISLRVTLQPTYSRNKILNEFGLQNFASGDLISYNKPGAGGSTSYPGGWI